MGIVVAPRFVSELPGPHATLDISHRLFPTFGWIPSMSQGARFAEELRRRVPRALFDTASDSTHRNVWTAGRTRGRAGMLLEQPTSTSNITTSLFTWTRIANTSVVDKMFPVAGNMSIAFGYKPMATVAANFTLLGSNTGTGCFNIRGTATQTFFNWTLGDPETSATVTWGDDNWVFLQSQERGVEIWQNGVKVGSSASTGARNADATDAYLGYDGVIFVTANGTRAQWPYFYCYDRPLAAGEIVQLHKNPFPFVWAV